MANSSWIHEKTLGPKSKDFWWNLDESNSLTITRTYITGEPKTRIISFFELSKIFSLIPQDTWFDLANNVEKLRKGTEKEGFGKLLFDEIFHNIEHA